MKSRGVLTVISGFSGVGKGTCVKRLIEKYGQYALSVSATTRTPREGETYGREYYFLSVEEFERMIREGQLYEYAHYVEHYYGTPKTFVQEQLESGKDVILEIEIQGALEIKRQEPEALLIFIIPPSAKALRERLLGRGTEKPEAVNARLLRALEEAKGADAYDFIVVNDKVEACVERLHSIICSAHDRGSLRIGRVREIQSELKKIVEMEGEK